MNGTWVAPVPSLIIGDLKAYAEAASVESIRIPGYWTRKLASGIEVAAPPQAGEKVIYHLHGGGYIQCSAHPEDITAVIRRGLVNNVVGFSPLDIIICGDSAGGNLALALTRYLVEKQSSTEANLPAPPAGIILLSPWCDLSESNAHPGSSRFRNENSDFVDTNEAYIAAKTAFLGPHGLEASETNRYISPACTYSSFEINFIGFPRTFIISGGAEKLLDQIETLHQRIVKDLGSGDGVGENEGKVRYLEAPDAIHDFIAFEWHEPERSSTLKEIANWIATQS